MKFFTSPLRVTLVYAATGSLWIIVSDWLAGDLAGNWALPLSIQTLKGLLFVAATSVLVYLLVRGALWRIRKEMNAQREANEALQEGNRDYAQQHETLTLLTRRLLQSPDQEGEMRKITETVADTLGVERVSIWHYDEGRTTIVSRDLFERGPRRHSAGHVLKATTYPSYFLALEKSRVIDANDALTDARTREFAESYLKPLGITSMLDTPILNAGALEGVLCFEQTGSPRKWTPAEKSFAVSVSNLVSLIITQYARRKDEEFRRAVVDCLPLGVITLDPEGCVQSWNDSATAIFGWTAAEIVGRNLPFIPDDKREEFIALRDRVLRGVTLTGIELTRRRRDGTLFDMRLSAAPLKGGDNESIGILALVEDISGKKRAEEELRRSEERFREMAENVQDIFYNYDPVENQILFAGKGYERIWGMPLEHLYANPMSYVESIHPDDRDKAMAAHWNEMAGVPTETEFRVLHPDGSVRWVLDRSTSILNEKGEVERIVGTMRDVTDIRAAQDALHESERRLSTLIDNLPGTAYRCRLDENWTMLYVSESVTELTGYSPAEFGKEGVITYGELVHPEDRAHVHEATHHAVAAMVPYEMEYRIIARDGKVKTVWERGHLIAGKNDAPGHLEGFILDITDKVVQEAALRQMQKMEAIGQLAGGVAHDFNNMLTVISVRSEIAMRKTEAGSALHASLREIHDAAGRAAALTRQLLTYARRQAAQPQVVQLDAQIRDMAGMLRGLVGEGIALHVETDAALWPVRIDPVQADQVLVNICINARDAIGSSKQGAVSITTRNETLDAQHSPPPGLATGDYVVLTIRDNGEGMTPETMERLFEPFFTTKPFGQGTGLGLPTVHGIVKQSGGHIEVESAPGKGATFRIRLPRYRPERKEHEATSRTASGQNPTVLLVENNPAHLEAASAILRELGFPLLVARSPAEALLVARHNPIEIGLLMTEAEWPDMSGETLAERFLAARPRARCLFMTGSETPDGSLGPDRIRVRKPFTHEELAAKLDAALRA